MAAHLTCAEVVRSRRTQNKERKLKGDASHLSQSLLEEEFTPVISDSVLTDAWKAL